MINKEQILKELNIVFNKRRWQPLSNNNRRWEHVIFDGDCYINREIIPYEKHLNKFTVEQLDNYIVEFIIPICKKYKINSVVFGGRSMDNNRIDIL